MSNKILQNSYAIELVESKELQILISNKDEKFLRLTIEIIGKSEKNKSKNSKSKRLKAWQKQEDMLSQAILI